MGSGKEDQAHALGTGLVIARDTENLPAAVAKVAGGLSTWSPMWSAATCSRTY